MATALSYFGGDISVGKGPVGDTVWIDKWGLGAVIISRNTSVGDDSGVACRKLRIEIVALWFRVAQRLNLLDEMTSMTFL